MLAIADFWFYTSYWSNLGLQVIWLLRRNTFTRVDAFSTRLATFNQGSNPMGKIKSTNPFVQNEERESRKGAVDIPIEALPVLLVSIATILKTLLQYSKQPALI